MAFGSLWLPVVLSTLAVVVASFISCMALPHHRSDYKKLPDEDAVLDALRKQSAAAGMYMAPGCNHRERKDPAVLEKMKRGPMALIALCTKPPNMGKALGFWFLYCFLVSFFTAYVARHSLMPGAAGLMVMRITATTAAAAHVLGNMPQSIWGGHPWSHSLKGMADGLVYALITSALFAWLWPAA